MSQGILKDKKGKNTDKKVEEIAGEHSPAFCYQCTACTSACPVAKIDSSYRPHKIVIETRLGFVDKILELNSHHKYDRIFNVINTFKYEEDGTRYHTKDELFKLESLINKYSEGQDIVNILGTDMTKRVYKVLDEVLMVR